MRTIKKMMFAAGIMMGTLVPAFQAAASGSAADQIAAVTSYSEQLVPSGEKDGLLEVTLEGEAGQDGYVYIIKSLKDMEPSGQVEGENLAETSLEEYNAGNLKFYRVQVADASKPVVVKADFICPGAYDVKKKAPDNGGESYPLSYAFTNSLPVDIESYSLAISVPLGNEIVKVTKPSSYSDFILSEKAGMRTVGVAKKLKPSGTVNLDFTYNIPAVSTTWGKLAVWIICLGVGAVVLAARWKEAREEQE